VAGAGIAPKDGIALERWLVDVRTLHERAKRLLAVETVHDLRVAIRRCRSVAQGLREIDDDEGRLAWRALNDAGRPLFQGLGALRDAQVMRDHAKKLLVTDDKLVRVLVLLEQRVKLGRAQAKDAVLAFDPDEFARIVRPLPVRGARMLANGPLLQHLALRRYEEARLMHVAAMRSKSTLALHELRIGVKRLRYTVESFLPAVHAVVGKSLKKAQDALGELHDYDVLLDWLGTEAPLHSEDRHRVCAPVRAAREAELAAYHASATGEDALWPRVRAALAQGRDVVDAHRAFVFVRANAGTREVALARAAEALVHGLTRTQPRAHGVTRGRGGSGVHAGARVHVPGLGDQRALAILGWACACALHAKPKKLVRALPVAVDFGEREHAMVGLIARAARGRMPDDRELNGLVQRDAALVRALAAIVSLASTLPARVTVKLGANVVVLVLPAAPDPRAFTERRAALEALLDRPVWLELESAGVPSSRAA
jgi:CHAD domain-containing protein